MSVWYERVSMSMSMSVHWLIPKHVTTFSDLFRSGAAHAKIDITALGQIAFPISLTYTSIERNSKRKPVAMEVRSAQMETHE